MAQTAHSLNPAKPGANLMSIDPINWRRYPSVPITAAMVRPQYVPDIVYTGGAPSVGADADNDGETGEQNSTHASRGQDWMTQAEKAALLGTEIAADVGKSYGAGARGDIEPHQRYPSLNPAEVPPEFRDSNTIVPETP